MKRHAIIVCLKSVLVWVSFLAIQGLAREASAQWYIFIPMLADEDYAVNCAGSGPVVPGEAYCQVVGPGENPVKGGGTVHTTQPGGWWSITVECPSFWGWGTGTGTVILWTKDPEQGGTVITRHYFQFVE
jgi:hypothetical protein